MIRNTMTDNHLTLFCLVDGEANSNAFSIKVPSDDTVDNLRKLIKAENAVKNLTIWRVSIPVSDDNDEIPIRLKNIADKDMINLGPVTRVSKVFPEDLPEETVHIIVQRPPPGNTSRFALA